MIDLFLGTAILFASAPRVWKVDGSNELHAALMAAASGDIIELRDGFYESAVITRPLTIRGRSGSVPIAINGLLEARGLRGPGDLRIEGLRFRRYGSGLELGNYCPFSLSYVYVMPCPDVGLSLVDCSVPVYLRNLDSEGSSGGDYTRFSGGPSLEIRDCPQVTAEHCSFRNLGHQGYWIAHDLCNQGSSPPRPEAAYLLRSILHASFCTFEGADGAPATNGCYYDYFSWPPRQLRYWTVAIPGGDGILLSHSRLVLDSSSCRGGIGGDDFEPLCNIPCQRAAPGGNGIRALDSSSRVELFATELAGNAGGRRVSGSCPTPPGTPGAPYFGPVPIAVESPRPLPALELEGPLSRGKQYGLRLRNAQLGPTAVFVANTWSSVILPGVFGGALLEDGRFLFDFRFCDPSSAQRFRLERDPLLRGTTLCFQAIEIDPATGSIYLGPIASGVVN